MACSSFFFLEHKEDLTFHLLTHSFTLSGLWDPSTERTATVSGCPCTPFSFSNTQPVQSLTSSQTWTTPYPVFSQFIYPTLVVWNCHWSSQNSDWHFTWTTWYDTLITIFTKCNTPITIYICYLDTFISCEMCSICWFSYYFTQHQHSILNWLTYFYNIIIVYIPLWNKMLPTNKFQWYINLV